MQNPQTLKKVIYLSAGIFGAFQFTRLFFRLISVRLLSSFGKPQLIRETSKITTSNPMMIPFVWSRKFYKNNIKSYSEDNLLKGVILDKKLEE